MTEFGHAVVRHYREVESAVQIVGAAQIEALSAALAERAEPAGETAATKTRRLAQSVG